MKYIVMMEDLTAKETIVIFDESINHDCMAEVVGRIKNQTWGDWRRVFRTPVAAGFTDGVKCWGMSETLNLSSRGEEDAKLIKSRGY
ncbi:hypothetical protein pf16_222 [Pseudomonas phage pf16]|uniref:Uncharacterized protein n=1 Tax=Pseudomonas phage pf16 TaxID=1815630 RepID=A0A1S5R482_9CAUD|nr:hypothetical protein FDG98_gp076 [Pseudomonas phage pf16]AND75145.1 hypothetical protein pf16_222 [Pseudomonas phage pf16]